MKDTERSLKAKAYDDELQIKRLAKESKELQVIAAGQSKSGGKERPLSLRR